MFVIKKVLENLEKEISALNSHYLESHVETSDVILISKLEAKISALKSVLYEKYSSSGSFAVDGYLTSKSAIVHETGQNRVSVSKAIERGKILIEYGSNSRTFTTALSSGELTLDHIDSLAKVNDIKYREFLNRDFELLVANACELDAQHFSYVIKYWKSIVDDQIGESSDEYKQFEQRYLFLNETLDGSWLIHGQLDANTGLLLNKALEDIVNKLWRNDTPEGRQNNTRQQYRCDAIGYLGQGYTNKSASATGKGSNGFVEFNFSPSITSDIVVDIEKLKTSQTTKDFLSQNLERKSPLSKTHSYPYVEQILCDNETSMPLVLTDGTMMVGRKVRVAPEKMKRELALQNPTCAIEGCSIPASWCDAHHIHHWAHGGQTKIENLALLCRRHHTMIHNDRTFEQKAGEQITKQKHSFPLGSPPGILTFKINSG